jgi:hypothetical protein
LHKDVTWRPGSIGTILMSFRSAVFEIVTEDVGRIPVPAWAFQEFSQPAEKRNFDYSKMLFADGRMVDHWRRGSSVPDIRQAETKMWFFFLTASYIDIGIEASHPFRPARPGRPGGSRVPELGGPAAARARLRG